MGQRVYMHILSKFVFDAKREATPSSGRLINRKGFARTGYGLC